MDNIYFKENTKSCFQLPHPVFENLNIFHSKLSNVTIFWNTYQIFVYNDFMFNEPPIVLDPDFYLEKLLLSNNYLICLDNNGYLHTAPLKFKISTTKKFKTSFQTREQAIICIELHRECIISLKCVSNTFYICTNKTNVDLLQESENKVLFENLHLLPQKRNTTIFHIYSPTEHQYNEMKDLFETVGKWKEHVTIFISFDRINLYSFLYCAKSCNEVLKPLKLYTSPSEISNINVIDTNVLVSMTIGTIVKISLTNLSSEISVVHLNTSIYKLFPILDLIIYTDGKSLWKTENTFTENIKFTKCFVKHVKDFVVIGDNLLCTTFTNLIYLFSIEDKSSYEVQLSSDSYCPADRILNNSDCILRIMDEVSKSNEFISKIRKEESYITTLSLSNRQEVMDDVINYNISVYKSFTDVPKDELIKIDNLLEYFDRNAFYLIVNITTKLLSKKFNDILSTMFGKLKIHLVVSFKKKNIKTLSVNVEEQMENINLIVPHTFKNDVHKVTVDIKLIRNVPSVFDTEDNIWTVLHRKRIVLNSEHFIKINSSSKDIHFIKDESKSIDDLLFNGVSNQYGHLYNFSRPTSIDNWSLYVALSEDTKHLDVDDYIKNNNNNLKEVGVLLKQIISEDFLKSKRQVIFKVKDHSVILQVVNDRFTKPLLKINCEKLEICFHIRNYLAQYIYNDFTDYEADRYFVNRAIYYTIEKFEKKIKHIVNGQFLKDEFLKLFEDYQKNVIGVIPF